MNLKNLSDNNLIENTKRLVREERELLTSILHHLKEIERRRLFSKLKYSSLFAYAVGELKYSESQADRRISAMRLLRDLPEIEDKITSGTLTLTNLKLAQTLFSKEKKAGRHVGKQEKEGILKQLENQSTREAEKIVSQISPEMKTRHKELNFNQVQDDSLREKLLKLKGHFAHSKPDMNLTELMHLLCDEKIESIESAPSAPRVDSKAHMLRQVKRASNHECSNCGSNFALEIDHKIPKAVGGTNGPENLRLLCRSCNQRAAIEYFGLKKMEPHLARTAQSEQRGV